MIVLDASAVLALLEDEPGAEQVTALLPHAVISAANLTEVFSKVVDRGGDVEMVAELLADTGLSIAPVLESDALVAAELRSSRIGKTLSLGDRLCLALAKRLSSPALTADSAWTRIETGIDVQLLRRH